MSLEPTGCFGINKMRMDKLYATRPVSSLKATLKLKPQLHIKVNHKLTWRHTQVEHVKTEEMRKYNKRNHLDLPLHLHKRATTQTIMKEEKNKKKTIRKMFHPDPNKSSDELEQESQEIIMSNKSLMISKPGEVVTLKLIWLNFVNITHSFLVFNL